MTRKTIEEAFRDGHAATVVALAPLWLRDHPDDLPVMLDYAEMLYLMTRQDDALRVYEEALKRVEGDGRWAIFNQIGRMYRYLGRFAEAEPWFLKAIDLQPGEVASYVLLGSSQARQGKLKEAEATHRAATQYVENSLADEAYHNLGLVLRGQGRLADAAECFRKAIHLCPTYTDAVEALADVERAMKLSSGASVATEWPAGGEPSQRVARNTASRPVAGDGEPFRSDLLERLRELSDDAEFFQELGKTFGEHKLGGLSKAAYEISLQIDPCDGFTHLYLGNWYYRAHQLEAALERFEYASQLMPDAPAPLWCMADVYEKQGRFDESEALHRKAVSVDPEDVQARRKLREFQRRHREASDSE